MRKSLAAIALSALLVTSAYGSEPEHVWSKSLLAGEKQYLTLHGEENGGENSWQIELTDEMPGQLPSMVWRKTFSREAEALRYALEHSRSQFFDHLSPQESPSMAATTEVGGASLWKVTQDWSWEWEQRYASWIETDVTPLFFKENQISTDCADVAYSLRWIFARINGLPAANHLTGSGVMFSQDSMKSEWARLPTDSDWHKDRRFLAALDYVLDMTYTHTLMADSYPIAISAESLILGTHHLELHGDSGHTMIVFKTDLSDTSTNPLQLMYSTTPRMVRELMHNGYWYSAQPKEGQGGFLRIRWPLRKGQGWDLAPPETHPFFSKEQYAPEFMKDHTTFAEAILLKLSPKFDFRARVREGIAYLLEQIQIRAETVSKGFEACRRQGCPEHSGLYDDWSTPSRDARISDLIAQIESVIETFKDKLPDLDTAWQQALAKSALALGNSNYALAEIVLGWKLKTYSSDPNQPIAARWGIDAQSFAQGVSAQFVKTLAERTARIAAQGTHCTQPGECSPGGAEWTSWSTYDIDADLTAFGGAIDSFCAVTTGERCNELKALPQSAILKEKGELSLWYISDPRVAANQRWGGRRTTWKNYVFNSFSPVTVTSSGLAATHARFFGESIADFHLIDLIHAQEILPPEGTHWLALDLKTNWVAARTSTTIRVQNALSNGGVPLLEVPAAQSTFAGWTASGVLHFGDFKSGISLFDLNRTPRFEAHNLPIPLAWDLSRPSWIAGKEFTGPYELLDYENGKLNRRSFQIALGARGRIWLEGQIPGFTLGTWAECLTESCNMTSYSEGFALNHKTGAITYPFGKNAQYQIAPDGRGAVAYHWNDNHYVELMMLDPELKVFSSTRFSARYFQTSGTGDMLFATFRNEANQTLCYKYSSGLWTAFQLLPDEKELIAHQGDFVTVLTKTGRERVRRFNQPSTLFETEPGSQVDFVGTRDNGLDLPILAVFHQSKNSWGAIYDLRNPGQPILTGRLPYMQRRDDGMPTYHDFNRPDPIVRERGLIVPFKNGRKLWIDDQQHP